MNVFNASKATSNYEIMCHNYDGSNCNNRIANVESFKQLFVDDGQ